MSGGWTSVDLDQVREDIDEINADAREATNDNLMHYLHRLKVYGEVHELPGWLAETARCHPTYESAICYIELPSGDPLPQSRQPAWPVPVATPSYSKRCWPCAKSSTHRRGKTSSPTS
ncbi:hypothetical protein Lesp02_44270 [Lentzea sp. NBRC 105346]|uniref:hypothetical protein n=1 Tax=Lentzea sp. NBRC 105346 TaxID=3032205 RepID=UPI0024A399AB|nr:hypothetical protein [Lentzea sp. NBRC 105346]GLZ32239.1 hypothetical protein Lesp02_44270 [Lentzea sp. NBRC 105346]